MQNIYIAGYDGGLTLDRKPFLVPEKAFSTLENAYVWRQRVKKREGVEFLGRLRRLLTAQSLGNSGASPWTFNIYSTLVPPIVGEPDAAIELGSVTITVGGISFTDKSPSLTTPNGTLVSATPGNSGTIDYSTGTVTLTHTAGAGVATTIDFNYYPSLPCMGLPTREREGINQEETIAFDTKYAYHPIGTGWSELVPGTTWTGTDADFFWATNTRTSDASVRIFLVTNNNINDPMRYYNPAAGGTWTDFSPGIAGATPTSADNSYLWQARLLIPYYGRVLALNTWEGATALTSKNYYNRCRFSQIGDPLQATSVGPPFVGGAWRSDIPGKGGFIDAPTNEQIISVAFFKNTLIVGFESETWQLRYVGEYGLPFIWERISNDFGTESTFSTILFDKGVLSVGDRAITISGASDVARIDQSIPDTVFNFRNQQNGVERVQGIRNYQKEVAYWCYSDSQLQQKFPNKVLVYNYVNETFAIFRDNVTAFGYFRSTEDITWDREDIFWYQEDVTWDYVNSQAQSDLVIGGNQQGFTFYYASTSGDGTSLDGPTLSITAVDLTVSPIRITVPNHNLESNELVLIDNMLFLSNVGVPVTTDMNGEIYQVVVVVDGSGNPTDDLDLYKWDGNNYAQNFSFTPATNSVYVGGGTIALLPVLNVMTKDFNPFYQQGQQIKISHIDFLTDVPVSDPVQAVAMTVNIYVNTSLAAQGNLIVGNRNVETSTNQPYYVPGSDITWHRFFATVAAQYIRIQMTYDDALMNQLSTHQNTWVLNAMSLAVRKGGINVF